MVYYKEKKLLRAKTRRGLGAAEFIIFVRGLCCTVVKEEDNGGREFSGPTNPQDRTR